MMLWERGGVNPDQANTEHGQILLSWAAESGYGETVRVFMERKDIPAAIPDNPNTDMTNFNSQPAPGYWTPRILFPSPQIAASQLNHPGGLNLFPSAP